MRDRKVFKTLEDPARAIRNLVTRSRKRILSELMTSKSKVNIEEAVGRLSVENIYSPIDLPYYPRSLVDGCAVISSNTIGAGEDNPVKLVYRGRIHVGDKPLDTVKPGTCIEVDTGAWIPLGADSVVPIEYVELEAGEAVISRSANVGMNIALPSTDIGKGDLVISKGTLITPEIAGSLASVGISEVYATRRIRVSIGSTGDELIEPGAPLVEGKIYNSNRHYLIGRTRSLGFESIDYGIVEDDLEVLIEALEKASRDSDLIIFTGGTSAGPEDVLYKAVGKIGTIMVHGLRIKPGKPTIIGEIHGKPFFGLPGNPRSAVNVFEKVVLPYLGMTGLAQGEPYTRKAYLGTTIYGARGRTTFLPVAAAGDMVWPVARDSYMIASYAWADGYIELPSEAYAPLYEKEPVHVYFKRYPLPTVFSFTDLSRLESISGLIEKLLESDTRYRIIPIPPEQVDGSSLESMDYIIASNIVLEDNDYSGFDTVEIGYRDLARVERKDSSECSYTGIRSGYSSLRKEFPEDTRVLYHPRFQGLKVLLEKGYLDCALLPLDMVVEEKTYRITVIARERLLFLYKRK